MPPRENSRKAKQIGEALQQSEDQLLTSASSVHNKYAKFIDGLKSTKELSQASLTVEDLVDSIKGLVNAIDTHANMVHAHTMSFIFALQQPALQYIPRQNSVCSLESRSQSPMSSTPSLAPSKMPHIAVPETAQENIVTPHTQASPNTGYRTTPVRHVTRCVSSGTGRTINTEYTLATKASGASVETGSKVFISRVEAVHMSSIAYWLSHSSKLDNTYSEMILVSVEENIITGEFTRKVLEYVKSRKSQNNDYDAFDELQENSETKRWCLSLVEEYYQPISSNSLFT